MIPDTVSKQASERVIAFQARSIASCTGPVPGLTRKSPGFDHIAFNSRSRIIDILIQSLAD